MPALHSKTLVLPEYIWNTLGDLANSYSCSRSAVISAIIHCEMTGVEVSSNPRDHFPDVRYQEPRDFIAPSVNKHKKRSSRVVLPENIITWLSETSSDTGASMSAIVRESVKKITPEYKRGEIQ